jgi:hypothetical protein
MDGTKAVYQLYLGLVLKEFFRAVTTNPVDLRPKPYGFPWELVLCLAIVGLFSILFFLCTSFHSVRSQFYVRRGKKFSILIEENVSYLKKLALFKNSMMA